MLRPGAHCQHHASDLLAQDRRRHTAAYMDVLHQCLSVSGRRSAVEAIGMFIAQSPGCRQGTNLAQMAAWQLLPCSGQFVPWDILDRRRDARSREQRRDRRQGGGERLKRR